MLQIIDGNPYVVGPEETYQTRNLATLRQLLNLAIQHKLPDVDFIISTTDECRDLHQPPRSTKGDDSTCDKNVSSHVSTASGIRHTVHWIGASHC